MKEQKENGLGRRELDGWGTALLIVTRNARSAGATSCPGGRSGGICAKKRFCSSTLERECVRGPCPGWWWEVQLRIKRFDRGPFAQGLRHFFDVCLTPPDTPRWGSLSFPSKQAKISGSISTQSVWVATITDLLEQSVPLQQVRKSARNVDPRSRCGLRGVWHARQLWTGVGSRMCAKFALIAHARVRKSHAYAAHAAYAAPIAGVASEGAFSWWR